MSKLDDLIAELCPDGVEYKELGEVLKNNNAKNNISKKDYKDVGSIPIIDQSQSYISGYTDDISAIPPALPSIIFGDHTEIISSNIASTVVDCTNNMLELIRVGEISLADLIKNV